MSLQFIFEGSGRNVRLINEYFGELTNDNEITIISSGNNNANSYSDFIDKFSRAVTNAGFEFINNNGRYMVKLTNRSDFSGEGISTSPPVINPVTNFYVVENQVNLQEEKYNGYTVYSEIWTYRYYYNITTHYENYYAEYKTNLKADYEDSDGIIEGIVSDTNEYRLKKSERKSGTNRMASQTVPIYFYCEEENEEEEPDPITPSVIGSFPMGIGADYMILLCKSDPAFVATQTKENLNILANDYLEKIEREDEQGAYYGSDNSGIYVLVSKNSVDESEDIQLDWEDLYPSESLRLENSTTELDGNVYYKVYLTGRCQIAQFDDSAYVIDQHGSTEVEKYDFPNGYYVIIGRTLRLFLLTDMNTADIDLETKKVIFADGNSMGYQTQRQYDYQDRVNYESGNLYLYKGHRVNLTTEDLVIDKDHLIIQSASNLRKVNMSDTVTSVGHLAGQANPDDGFFMSENLTYVGQITISYTAGTEVYLNSTHVTEVAANAFYNNEAVDTNLILYFCTDWRAAKSRDTLTNGYIAPSSSLQRVGAQAFYGLKSSAVNLTACSNLQYLGEECFAMAAACKDFYYLITQLSQRSGVSANLIYLPDGCDYNAAVGTTLTYNSSFYAQDSHKTFGEFLSGYKLNPRDREVDVI